jgi:endoglucanase
LATGASPEDIENIDTVPSQEAYVLYGGVVGGPDRNDQFWDLRGDWVQSEVGLDYVAPVLTIAARALVNGTSDPWYTRLQAGSYEQRRPKGQPCDAAVTAGCSRGDWRTGKIVMGALVGTAGLVVFSLGTIWMVLIWRSRATKF